MNEPAFNLIDESWIPMRRRNGSVETVPPWRVTDDLDGDPFVAFAWPRPDFNGAAHELLIGLLATSSAPRDDDEWADEWDAPPSPEELRHRFAKVRDAFELDGPGPRFMQDTDRLENDGKGRKPVSALLIDSPAEKTKKENTDLFVKRDQVNTLGRAAAAMALFTINSYAPQGGSGHRTSLRGGGPLTTLVIADHDKWGATLWGRLWPNVETQEQIDARQPPLAPPSKGRAAVFPWLGPTRTSDLKHGGVETNQTDVAPLQVYWGMPRRIRLVFEAACGRLCDIMGTGDSIVTSTFVMPKYGTNYMAAGFDHPLTPYYRKSAKKTEWLPIHPEPGRISYRMYPGCVVPSPDGKQRPAAVVSHWQSRIPGVRRRRLLAFGYDMRSMKPRGWLEGEMPLVDYPPATRPALEDFIQRLTAGAETVQRLLIDAIKDANWDRRKQAKGDFRFVGERLYRNTEAAFHDAVGRAVEVVGQQLVTDDPTVDMCRRWSDVLRRAALALFREYAPSEGLEDRNMHRHAKALHFLGRALAGHDRKGRSLFEKDLKIPSPRRRTEAA